MVKLFQVSDYLFPRALEDFDAKALMNHAGDANPMI